MKHQKQRKEKSLNPQTAKGKHKRRMQGLINYFYGECVEGLKKREVIRVYVGKTIG